MQLRGAFYETTEYQRINNIDDTGNSVELADTGTISPAQAILTGDSQIIPVAEVISRRGEDDRLASFSKQPSAPQG
jgi:hypothetical protein